MTENYGSESLLLSSNPISKNDAKGEESSNSNLPDEISAYKALWRAVITQALMDAGNNFKKPEYKKIKAQAISWLDGRSDDFEEVCIFADLEPEYVKEKSRNAIKNNCKWRKEKPKKFSSKKLTSEKFEGKSIKQIHRLANS